MAQWAVRLAETVWFYRELTMIFDAASIEEARAHVLTRLNDHDTGLEDLRDHRPEEDYSEVVDWEPITILSLAPWPPDTSAPARHLETPSRLDR